MGIRDLFAGYQEYTNAAELSATGGHSLHPNRVTTTPAFYPTPAVANLISATEDAAEAD